MRTTPFRLVALSLATALMTAGAVAQTVPKPAAKAPAKPAAAPAPAKAKPKLMSRDELRACLDRQDANAAEAKEVEAADATLKPERDAILKESEAVREADKALKLEQEALLADMESMKVKAEELKEKMKSLSKKEQQALAADYQKQADEVNARIEPHNAKRRALSEQVKAANLDARIDVFNKRKDEVATRFDKLGDAQDAWRNECGNRPYDEADEIAIKKERAAKAAAGK
jgi:chromosome segregation ATPase